MYRARQDTQRSRIDAHVRNTVADAFAACMNDVHRGADDPTDQASAAEARRVRASARRFLTEQGSEILARLTEPPPRLLPPCRSADPGPWRPCGRALEQLLTRLHPRIKPRVPASPFYRHTQ